MELENNLNKVVQVMRKFEDMEICHDYFDICIEGVNTVLSWYGVIEEWGEIEGKILEEFLLEIACQNKRTDVIGEEFKVKMVSADKIGYNAKIAELEFLAWEKTISSRSIHSGEDDLFDFIYFYSLICSTLPRGLHK